MKPVLIAVITLLLNTALAAAQGDQGAPHNARPAAGMGSKTMVSCRADIRMNCPTASSAMQKECLVKNWDRISSDCQDAVGTPGKGRAGATE